MNIFNTKNKILSNKELIKILEDESKLIDKEKLGEYYIIVDKIIYIFKNNIDIYKNIKFSSIEIKNLLTSLKSEPKATYDFFQVDITFKEYIQDLNERLRKFQNELDLYEGPLQLQSKKSPLNILKLEVVLQNSKILLIKFPQAYKQYNTYKNKLEEIFNSISRIDIYKKKFYNANINNVRENIEITDETKKSIIFLSKVDIIFDENKKDKNKVNIENIFSFLPFKKQEKKEIKENKYSLIIEDTINGLKQILTLLNNKENGYQTIENSPVFISSKILENIEKKYNKEELFNENERIILKLINRIIEKFNELNISIYNKKVNLQKNKNDDDKKLELIITEIRELIVFLDRVNKRKDL